MQRVLTSMRDAGARFAVCVLFLLAITCSPARAEFDLPQLARAADALRADVAKRATGTDIDPVALLAAAKSAEEKGDAAGAIRDLERLAGAGYQSFDVWHRLTLLLTQHAAGAPRTLATAYAAYQAAKDEANMVLALRLVGETATRRLETLAAERRELSESMSATDRRLYGDTAGETADVAFPIPGMDPKRRSAVPPDATGRAALRRALREIRAKSDALESQYIETIAIAHAAYLELFRRLDRPLDDRLAPWDQLKEDIERLRESAEPAQNGVAWRGGPDSLAACIDFTSPIDIDPKLDRKRFVTVGRHASTEPDAPTVAVSPEVRIESRSLCLIGLEHGNTYSFTLAKGLPLTSRASLTHDIRLAGQRSPDLPATVRFKGGAYVLPAAGRQTVEMQAVNVETLTLELVRIPDRAIHRQLPLGLSGGDPAESLVRELYEEASDPIWHGTLVLGTGKDNRLHTVSLPIGQLLEERRRFIRSDGPTHVGSGTAGGFFKSGSFYRDPVSHGSDGLSPFEPGVYALLAKLPYTPPTGSTENDDATDEPPAAYDPASFERRRPRQWIVVTDISLSYWKSRERLYVIARSLSTGAALAGVRVELVARNNRVLAERTTDANGTLELPVELAQGSHGNKPAALLAFKGSDFSFIDLARGGLDLSRLDVGGRAPPGDLDAFVYTDRGVYRPNAPDARSGSREAVNALVLLRDGRGNAVSPPGPLRVRLRSLLGPVLDEVKIAPDKLSSQSGGDLVSLDIPPTAPFGSAVVEVFLGDRSEPIGRADVSIAHVRPDRARLVFDDEKDWTSSIAVDGGYRLSGTAKVQYLTAALDASGRAVDVAAGNLGGDVEIVVAAAKQPFGVCKADYTFGLDETGFKPFLIRNRLLPSQADGTITLGAETAALPQSLSPLEARVTLTVDDAAGRAASRSTIVPVRRDVSWIGIGRVATRETSKGTFAVDVDAMAVDAAGSPRGEIDIAYKLYREQPEFVWFREEGEWNYRAEVSHLPVAGYQGSVRSTAAANTPCDAANVALPPVELSAGDYVMELSGRDGMRARRRFSIGAASAGLDRPEPSILTIRANRTRTTYKAGETAEFIIESPFPARILSAVVSAGRVLGWYEGETVLDTDKRHAERLSIPLARSWQGQLHVVSTAFRTGTDGTVARGPARAIGVMPLAVDIDEHVRIASLQGTPHRVTPASGIPLIRLEAKDKAGAPVDGEAMIALFAVDEGLLTLTQHAPPSPIEHFYGTRRLDFDVHDSYTRLLLAADPGGDGGLLLQRLIFNNYLSQRIVAAKLLKRVTFNKGVALIEKPGFDLSGYAGTVKLAAVAWSESWIAIAEHGTLVRDAIVADLGLPRFLSPGDKPQIPLMLENVEALDDDYAIELSRDVRRALLPGKDEWIDLNDQGNTISLRLERGKRQIVHLELGIDADDLREGDLKIGVELKSRSPDNPARLAWNWRSRIRLPFTNAVRRVASLEVAPGATGVLNLPPQALASMKRPRLQVRLSTRAIPLPARGSPRDLARSPDTLERLVWSGMQLVGDEAGEHRGAMQRVIEAILALQQPSGAFADFKPQTTSEPGEFRTSEADSIALDANERLWHMAGAVELLREAKASGFATDRALGRAADSLKSQVAAMLKPRDDYFRPTPEVMIPERSVTLDGSASGSLSASFEDILVEDAQALGIAPGTGSRVLEVAEGGAAAKAGLVPGDVVLEIDGFRAGTPSEVGRVIRKRPAGSRAVLALLRDGKRQSVVVTLDAVAPPMRSEAADAPAEIDGDAQRLTCTRGLAYAIATLVRLDRVALAEMEQLAALCGPKETEAGDMPSDGIAPLIAASALVEFGKAERAAPLLAGFRAARAPQDGEERAPELQAPDPALDAALTLVFLRRAEPAAPELSVIAARFPERLSPPSQAWLARLARESADGSQLKVELTPARVGTEDLVEVRDGGTATTRFVEPQVLSQGGVRVRNTGDVPVVATVFAHGLDSQATPAEGGGRVQFVRRFAKLDGAGLGDGDIEVKQNEVFVVLVEGTAMAGPDGNVSDRIVLIDLLPSGLEIVRAVTPGAPLAGAEGGEDGADDTLMTNREPLKPFGHVIYNEMRDDKYVAVLQPHHKGGQFRAVYLVRATVPGEYRVPQSRVEDWRQPEVGVFRDEARTLRITRATAP